MLSTSFRSEHGAPKRIDSLSLIWLLPLLLGVLDDRLCFCDADYNANTPILSRSLQKLGRPFESVCFDAARLRKKKPHFWQWQPEVGHPFVFFVVARR
jgi:hypothetical protein